MTSSLEEVMLEALKVVRECHRKFEKRMSNSGDWIQYHEYLDINPFYCVSNSLKLMYGLNGIPSYLCTPLGQLRISGSTYSTPCNMQIQVPDVVALPVAVDRDDWYKYAQNKFNEVMRMAFQQGILGDRLGLNAKEGDDLTAKVQILMNNNLNKYFNPNSIYCSYMLSDLQNPNAKWTAWAYFVYNTHLNLI